MKKNLFLAVLISLVMLVSVGCGIDVNGYVDITGVIEEKTKLLQCYASQIRHVRRYDHMAKGMSAWNCRFLPNYKADPVARYVEVFSALPLQDYLNLIEAFYLPDLAATYRGLPLTIGMQKIHQEVVGRER